MKKWMIGLLSVCLLFLLGTYVFIPGKLTVSKIATISSAKNATNRFLLDESKWHKWWPKQGNKPVTDSNSTFYYNGYSYHIKELFTDKIDVLTTNGNDTINSSINIIPLDNYSVRLQWNANLQTSSNPFKRIMKYREGVSIRNNMASLFQTLNDFLEESSNVYGFPIKEIISKDSTLVAVKHISKNYPSTKEIYSLIDTMRKYVVQQGALETDPPMLRVAKLNDSVYQTMVAIPINKVLSGNEPIFFLRFVPYKTLTGTVHGGVGAIEHAFKQMEIFVDDHQRSSMAVPFQSLVTDRTVETDSLKWVTVICQPVS